jgi:hypothetical protein
MPTDNRSWWAKRRFGLVSLALSLAEVSLIYGIVAWVLASNQPHILPSIRKVVDGAFLLGGLGSLGFAVAGLLADPHRLTALIAIFVATLALVVCGLQMLV